MDFLERLDQRLNTDVCGLFLRSLDESEVVEGDQIIIFD